MVRLGLCNNYLRYSKDSTGGGEYEHRLVAERMLGRPLEPGEVVHHEDRNRSNNSPENLIVFKTDGDHHRHHRNVGELIKLEDGSHIRTKVPRAKRVRAPRVRAERVPRPKKVRVRKERVITYKIEWPSREELHKLIWDKAVVLVASDLGVSDKAVEKRCKSLDVPKPARGFWRKIETQKFEGQYCPLP